MASLGLAIIKGALVGEGAGVSGVSGCKSETTPCGNGEIRLPVGWET